MKLIFFLISFFIFLSIIFAPRSFDKLEKKINTLISYFLVYFSWHNQILKNIFQLIFHDIVKCRKIIHF
jgi:hypothetical protein